MEQWILLILYGGVFGLIIGAVSIWLYNSIYLPKVYNYSVTLKEIVKGRVVIRETRGRILRKQREANTFKLFGKNFKALKVPIPPDECTEVTQKGKRYATGYIINNEQIIWAEDKLEMMQQFEDDEIVKAKLQPFTQEQRQVWLNQEKKANRDKPFKLADFITVLAPSMMVLMMFVMVFVFWEDITNPMLQAQDQQTQFIQQQSEMVKEMQTLAKIYNGVQILEDDPNTVSTLEPFKGGGGK